MSLSECLMSVSERYVVLLGVVGCQCIIMSVSECKRVLVIFV